MRYDYKCDVCNVVIEREFSIAGEIPDTLSEPHDVDWQPCPGTLHRQFSLFGFSVKHQFHIINQRPGKGAIKNDSSHNLRGKRGGYEMEPKGKKP